MADPLQIHRASAPPAQVEGNNQETTDAGHAVASISSLVSRCFRDFQDLLDELSTLDEHSQANSKVSEGLGRLRVWAGNFGAHRKQTDRLSLDHRLREAPELHRGVRSHLNDISETIKEASAYLSRNPESTSAVDVIGEDSDSESSDSDGFWEQIRTEGSHRSPVDVYIDDLSHTVTSLYKLSLSLQNPAHRDRSVQASRIDLYHFEFYDKQHVCDKFNLPLDSMLAQRLGRANTKRRQLLAYYKDHADKISKYIDVALNKAVSARQLPVIPELQSGHQQKPPTISTQWTQDTTVSTVYQDNDVASDSGRTKFSETTSTAGDQDQNSIPPPPGGISVIRRSPFICPYCHQTVQVENDDDWIYHVYSDLRPYICTFGGCVKENQLYDSFTEWSAHERQFHRREWFCTRCPYTSAEKAIFIHHLDDKHADTSKEQRQDMANQSRPSTLAQKCPLCPRSPISSSSRFQQHLARHLQQLAFFVLPRREPDDEESQAREEDSNESRQALMMDVEDRESLYSFSADSRGSVAESFSSGLHSPTDGRLLDDLPVETISDTLEETATIDFTENNIPLWEEEGDLTNALATLRMKLGPEHPETIACMERVTNFFWEQGRFSDLEPRLNELLDLKRRVLGPENFSTVDSMTVKGWMLYQESRYEEAEDIQATVLGITRRNLGIEHPITLRSTQDLVTTYTAMGKFAELAELTPQFIELSKRFFGEDDPTTLWAIRFEAIAQIQKGDYATGEMLLLRIMDASDKPNCSPDLQKIRDRAAIELANAYFEQGDSESADRYLKLILDRVRADTPTAPDSERLLNMGAIADVYFAHSRLEDAETLYRDVLKWTTRLFGTLETYRLYCGQNLARVFYRKGKFAEARELMAKCAEELLKTLGPQNPHTLEAFQDLEKWAGSVEGTDAGESQTIA